MTLRIITTDITSHLLVHRHIQKVKPLESDPHSYSCTSQKTRERLFLQLHGFRVKICLLKTLSN